MGYEIDFLPVGNGSKGGDAIAFRYGNLHGSREEQTVFIVDGGYTDDGEALVDLVKSRYRTESVDVVVSTHPDRDHIKGLEVVLRQLRVGALWMHIPENHDQLVSLASRSEHKAALVGERLAKSLTDADSLLKIASDLKIPVDEPFTGLSTWDGAVEVVGPDLEYYKRKLDEMKGKSATLALSESLAKLYRAAQEFVFKYVPESVWLETLTEQSDVTASNNSSAVLLLRLDGHMKLLTADAGAEALHRVSDQLILKGIGTGTLDFVQVPHHGSRRNVTPSLLNRLLGPKGQESVGIAFASTPPQNPEKKHPAKKALNAFTRRGYKTFDTAGEHISHSLDAPERGWGAISPHPLYPRVEEHDD